MLSRVLSIVLGVLMGLSAIFTVLYFVEAISIDFLLGWTYFLFGLTAVSAIVFPIVNLFTNLKSGKRALISVLLIGVLAIISYLLSSNEMVTWIGSTDFYREFYADVTSEWEEIEALASSLSWKVGTVMISMYILAAVAIVAAIYSEVSKAFK